jgi:hypothetical protein
MLRRWINIFMSTILSLALIPFHVKGADYWQQHVAYSIDAELDVINHRINGFQKIVYTNNSPDTLSEINFFLYPNAFKKGSIMDREAKAASIKLISSPEETGYLKVQFIKTAKVPPPHNEIKFKLTYNEDSTLVKLIFNSKLPPGDKLELSLKFVTKIRKFNSQYDKSGYKGQLYEISQWYPKVCVYDKNGWDETPHHFLGEFYGEFASYDVTMDVPDSFIVAATGELSAGNPGWENAEVDSIINTEIKKSIFQKQSKRRVVSFHAENVHDFVWTTSPDYVYEKGNWGDILIHILYQKSFFKQWNKKALNAARQAIEWLENNIGKFPYPQITIGQGLTDGGMEYPMMTVLGYYDFLLTFHEIAHMYFYGAVANNEHKEGWLDEGLVTFLAEIYKNEKYGKSVSVAKSPSKIKNPFNQFKSNPDYSKVQLNSLYYYFYSGFENPLATECYQLKNPYLYGYNIYIKPTKFFAILDYIVGREKFINILKSYYQKWKFKHVDLSAFQNVVEDVFGEKLDWFFLPWITGTPRIDYACSNIKSYKQKTGVWKTDVVFKRLGDGVLPVEAEALTTKNDRITKMWDGRESQTTMTFLTESKIKRICLDPRDIILDQNRFNNGTPQFKLFLYPEFPSMYYMPRDSYSVFLWPQVWYNKINGAKLGLKIFGSYLNRYAVMRNYLWYNLESHNFDFNLGYSFPWEKINKNLWRHFYIKKIEGRISINANLNYNVAKSFAQPPTQNFRIGFSHFHLFDEKFDYRFNQVGNNIFKVKEWDPGNINKLYIAYFLDSSVKIPHHMLTLDFQLSAKTLNSDFDYTRLSLQYDYETIKHTGKIRFKFRSFFGYSSPSNKIPVQDRFGIAEANPIKRFNYYYLRSPGSYPTWINYHLPGDGNLRGYLNQFYKNISYLSSDKLVTTNTDLTFRKLHQFFPKSIRKIFAGIDFNIFFDSGLISVYETKEQFLFDAGFGLIINKMILGKLRKVRIEFPIWLNQPNLTGTGKSEPNMKFRWLLSFQ